MRSGTTHRIESGLYVRSIRARQITNFFVPPLPGTRVNLKTFDRSAAEESYYLQDTYTNQRHGLSLTGGLRIDHSGLTSETKISPRMAASLRVMTTWKPEFARRASDSLQPERRAHLRRSLPGAGRDV